MVEQNRGDIGKETMRKILDKETLRAHLESQGEVVWVEMQDLLKERSEACVDGRGEQGIVGVP
ncbi:MAG: hypothetical protein WCW16_02870, partial [Candidatus Magasanikbacteria bacterium]